MPANYYVQGGWNVICDSCGFKKKNHQVRKRWDGLIVCADTCWETDHPQKYIRVSEDTIAPPFVRPEAENTYQTVCYVWGRSAFADLGEADCMRADLASPTYAFLYLLKNDDGPGPN
jgi:hypothetical protein